MVLLSVTQQGKACSADAKPGTVSKSCGQGSRGPGLWSWATRGLRRLGDTEEHGGFGGWGTRRSTPWELPNLSSPFIEHCPECTWPRLQDGEERCTVGCQYSLLWTMCVCMQSYRCVHTCTRPWTHAHSPMVFTCRNSPTDIHTTHMPSLNSHASFPWAGTHMRSHTDPYLYVQSQIHIHTHV